MLLSKSLRDADCFDCSKAYIHSRMRRRTADFLQGTFLHPKQRGVSMSGLHLLTRAHVPSPTACETGRRRKGAEDGEREDIQASWLRFLENAKPPGRTDHEAGTGHIRIAREAGQQPLISSTPRA